MPANRDETSQYAHHRAAHYPDENHLAIEEDRLNEVLVDDSVRDPDEQKCEQSAQHSFDEPVDEEWKTNEHVSCPDESHDGDLLRAGKHGHPDRGTDDDDCDCSEGDAERDSSDRRDVSQAIQLLDPLLAIADVVDEMVGLDPIGNGFNDRRAAHAGPQIDFNGSRKNARLEYIGEFAHLFARALESLLLRDIIDSQDFGKVSHVLHCSRDLLDISAVA